MGDKGGGGGESRGRGRGGREEGGGVPIAHIKRNHWECITMQCILAT